MTTVTGQDKPINQVHYDEPPVKNPPLLAVGPLAWIRDNLFGSVTDTLLTLLGATIVISAVTGIINWSVSAANWFAITFNIRQFMIGRLEATAEWRVQALVILIAFIVGFSLAAWSRVSRGTLIRILVLIAFLFIIPAIISATVPQSPTYLSSGSVDIVSGSATQVPLPQVAFIGRAGETISIRVATEFSEDDTKLARIFSFSDEAANTLRNAAANRLSTQARIAEVETLLTGNTLTARQREALQNELEGLETPPAVTEIYQVNTDSVTVRVLDGKTLEEISAGVLSADDAEAFNVVLPEDGWYVLEKATPEGSEAVVLLAVDGVIPILERAFVRDESGSESSTSSSARGEQYTRMTDHFRTEDTRPTVGTTNIPTISIINNQYRGERSFQDYLNLYLGPFLSQINSVFLILVAVATGGYFIARLIDRQFSPKERAKETSRAVVMWMYIILPVAIFTFIAGVGGGIVGVLGYIFGVLILRAILPKEMNEALRFFLAYIVPIGIGFLIENLAGGAVRGILPTTGPQLWGGLLLTLLLTAVGIVGALPIGIGLALGRRSHLPVVRTACTLYIELVRGVPLITVLFMSMLLVPFVVPAWGGPTTAPYRAMVAVTLFSAAYLAENVRGGLQSLPPGQEEAGKALGLSNWQVIRFITMPQALRAVIPALVGQFIALYKDTSLVAIVGLIDLTGIANSVVAQPAFLGLRRETYLFISVIYFAFSYVMSILSRRLEESGSGAARR